MTELRVWRDLEAGGVKGEEERTILLSEFQAHCHKNAPRKTCKDKARVAMESVGGNLAQRVWLTLLSTLHNLLLSRDRTCLHNITHRPHT